MTSNAEYQKGYRGGRRNAAAEDRKERIARERQEFRRSVFLAVLPAIMASGNWQTGGKTWTTVAEHVDGAWSFADSAMRAARFE